MGTRLVPLTAKVAPQERRLLAATAALVGLTMSALIREGAVAQARLRVDHCGRVGRLFSKAVKTPAGAMGVGCARLPVSLRRSIGCSVWRWELDRVSYRVFHGVFRPPLVMGF
jgi:hypothetical protein